MASRIYLFSYECGSNKEWTDQCITERMASLYDIKQLHHSLYLIKTTDDVRLLETHLIGCFDRKDTYFLVDITDQPHQYQNLLSKGLFSWMDNL
ncbi:hypothetical protein [Planococcus sp. ISL-110]|uniref:hypothetical protein n=1 Tax=Planococcus sp. ISL-110 TaxID=2819167 RepID=UPI001BEC3BBE|nr:hypothetical protein [Planococcus sp. ISL-110]MBT2571150.1 hypothetical protein [Planococcus sp. ISL-110]